MKDLKRDDSLYPIAILIDELKNEDVALRLNSVRRLGTIALALGEERTRSELIPFVSESNDDEDEVLLSLAEELGNFVPYVGGSEHAQVLLSPLEGLCAVEETVVRERAVQSLVKIAGQMPASSMENYLIPMVKRLGGGEWFTSRISACGLLPSSYSLSSEAQRESICGLFHTLSQDDTPMVRRAAAQCLGPLAEVADAHTLSSTIAPTFLKLTQDDQDSVRLLAVQCCGSLARTLSRSECQNTVVPIVQRFAQDKSWRVRYNVAQQLHILCVALGAESSRSDVLPPFLKLLRDSEAEVRVAAASKVASISNLLEIDAVRPHPTSESQLIAHLLAHCIDEEFLRDSSFYAPALSRVSEPCYIMCILETLEAELLVPWARHTVLQVTKLVLPCIKALAADSSQHVRSSLAAVVMEMAPTLGKAATIEHLLPVFLSLLKDEVPDVRLNIISKLDQVNEVIGIDLLGQSLMPAIENLADDTHWRVRLAIIQYIPLLATQLGADSFQRQLGQQCLRWLEDQVYCIREAATQNLQKLASEFGPDWAKDNLVPQVLAMVSNAHYLHRMTILGALAALAPAVGHDTLCNTMLPVVLSCATDKVPNIKFTVAKLLERLVPLLDAAVADQTIKPCLQALAHDSDVDVQFFAQQALVSCEVVTPA